MIKIINKTINSKDIDSSNISISNEFAKTVNSWMYDSKKAGIDYLMRTISEVEPGNYLPQITQISENEFTMEKENGEIVTFKIKYGDIEDYPELSVTKGDTTRNYSCGLENGQYQIILSSVDQKLSNGNKLHQLVCSLADSMQISNDDYTVYLYIVNPNKSDKPYFIPFHNLLVHHLDKMELSENIDALFNTLYYYIKDDKKIKDYSVSIVNNKENGFQNISVKNRVLKNMTRTIDGISYSIDTTTSPYTLSINSKQTEEKDLILNKLFKK